MLLVSLQVALVHCKARDGTTGEHVRTAASAPASSAPAQGAAPSALVPPSDDLRARTVLARLHGAPKAMTLDGSALVVMNVVNMSAALRDLGARALDDPGNEFVDVMRVPTTGGEALVVGDAVRMGGVPVVAGNDLLLTSRPYLLGDDLAHRDGPRPPDEIARFSKVGGKYPPRIGEKHPYPPTRVTAAFAYAEPAFAVLGEDLLFYAPKAATDERLDVMRMPRAGGEATRVTRVARGARRLFLIADTRNVYFPEQRRLAKAPLTGGEASTVAEVGSIWAAVSDGEHVYFSARHDGGRGSIYRAPVGGGPVETLAIGFSSPMAMALDAASVWFVDADPENGSIYRVPKGGGNTVAVARGQKQPRAIVVDEAHVYWTNELEGTVCRIDK